MNPGACRPQGRAGLAWEPRASSHTVRESTEEGADHRLEAKANLFFCSPCLFITKFTKVIF